MNWNAPRLISDSAIYMDAAQRQSRWANLNDQQKEECLNGARVNTLLNMRQALGGDKNVQDTFR